MPSEAKRKGDAPEALGPPLVVHADGTLTLTEGAVEIEVRKGAGYRGTIAVPRAACTLRVMGRTIAVYDQRRLVHLCSRCKPTAEVARLVVELGDRVSSQQRSSFATLLALRQESAAYRPAGEGGEDPLSEPAGRSGAGSGEAPAVLEGLEVPPGFESLRRVYLSQAAMERDSRRLRAAGWIAHQAARAGEPEPAAASARRGGRWRGLLRAASPDREIAEGVVIWVRRLDPAGAE